MRKQTRSINSSKVYCKLKILVGSVIAVAVLIVAKCIVNINENYEVKKSTFVLIVAKCIVNVIYQVLQKSYFQY